ncbi:MAG: hypothetical protein P4M08_12535 [Oligoflexia bacterium]|nr:hypothetical protein [Oligoflexia bacterium]
MRSVSYFLMTLIAAGSFVISAQAFSGELDNEGQATNVEQRSLAADLPATVVVRVAKDTHEVSVLQAKAALAATPASVSQVADSAFLKVASTDQIAGSELDHDSSTNSWFFYFNNCSYWNPSFYYGGYNFYYYNYFYYSYGFYNYYFYRWY